MKSIIHFFEITILVIGICILNGEGKKIFYSSIRSVL